MKDRGIILRFGRIKSRKQLLSAFMHNKREFINPDSNIDASKTSSNFSFDDCTSSADCMYQFEEKLEASQIKILRSNAVLAVEVLISISAHLSQPQLNLFFKNCTSWIHNYFGVPILSVDVHLDESNPHLHAILLPVLVNGRLNGHKLIGNISNMRLAQKSLYEVVGKKFGMTSWQGDKRNKQELIYKVLERLKEDAATKSAVWPLILKAIKANPHHFLGVLS